MDFVALDVETANGDIASICQIGIASYSNGNLIDEYVTLINPESHFSQFNIRIHGIRQSDVTTAPTFVQAFAKISDLLSNAYVVSHTFFDKTAIENSIQKHSLQTLEYKWIDSCKSARKAWGHIPLASYGLANVSQFIGYQFKHHDALEDAKACGEIMCAALLDSDTTIDSWYIPPSKTKPKRKKPNKAEPPSINPNGVLIGHSIAFTGKMSITRAKATALAAQNGCIFSKSVQWHTNYLVIGSAKKGAVGKSSKQIQAETFNQNGHNIRLLSEPEFQILMSNS